MRKLFILLIFSSLLISNSLTIYSNNFSSYYKSIDFNISKQNFVIYYKELPKTIFIDSIYPKFSKNIQILSESFIPKPNIVNSILKSNLDKEVKFYENRFSKEPKIGKLINIDPIVIESNKKYYIINDSSRVVYNIFPKIDKAYIKWNLKSKNSSKKAKLNLSYQFSDLKWRCNYIANLDTNKLYISVWAKIENNTDINFKDVNLTLIAGKVNKNLSKDYTRYKNSRRVLAMSAVANIEPKLTPVSNLYKYSFKYKIDIFKDEVKYLPIFHNKELNYNRYGLAYNSNFNNYGEESLYFNNIIPDYAIET